MNGNIFSSLEKIEIKDNEVILVKYDWKKYSTEQLKRISDSIKDYFSKYFNGVNTIFLPEDINVDTIEKEKLINILENEIKSLKNI